MKLRSGYAQRDIARDISSFLHLIGYFFGGGGIRLFQGNKLNNYVDNNIAYSIVNDYFPGVKIVCIFIFCFFFYKEVLFELVKRKTTSLRKSYKPCTEEEKSNKSYLNTDQNMSCFIGN